MPNLLVNISKGFSDRVKKIFKRQYSVFDIGWTKEKFLKLKSEFEEELNKVFFSTLPYPRRKKKHWN